MSDHNHGGIGGYAFFVFLEILAILLAIGGCTYLLVNY